MSNVSRPMLPIRFYIAIATSGMAATQSISLIGQAQAVEPVTPATLAHGTIGEIGIGIPLSKLQSLIRRKLPLNFAGDQRAGLSFDKAEDLANLGIADLAGTPVLGADVFFRVKSNSTIVEMIYLGIPCNSVEPLSQQLSSYANVIRTNGLSGWKNIDRRYKYVWGADTKPVCRFWLRDG